MDLQWGRILLRRNLKVLSISERCWLVLILLSPFFCKHLCSNMVVQRCAAVLKWIWDVLKHGQQDITMWIVCCCFFMILFEKYIWKSDVQEHIMYVVGKKTRSKRINAYHLVLFFLCYYYLNFDIFYLILNQC